MNDNVYAAPRAQLINAADQPAAPDAFYVVSSLKFHLLFFLTMGFYSVYWFYRHWKAWKSHSREDLWPVPRAIFNIFFVHALFGLFVRAGMSWQPWKGLVWATVYVVAAIASNFVDAFPMVTQGWRDLGSLAFLIIMGIALANGQQGANEACGDSEGVRNAHFSVANIVWMVIGSIFWLFVLLSGVLLSTSVDVRVG
ncbi:MAG: hypothetical protein IPK97_19570 [Ahniella sp.]|nr:hypothetical protein [Ahniella sp.]